MVSIKIYKNQDSYTGFECIGHAGYAESGNDIVCAAISILVINTINSIEEFTSSKMDVSTDEEKGIIKIKFLKKPEKDAELLLNSMVLGIESTKKQYSDYIKIVYKEG